MKKFAIIALAVVTVALVWFKNADSNMPLTTIRNSIRETVGDSTDQISLTITTPKDGSVVSSPNLTVQGKTLPSASLFINDDTEFFAEPSGEFTKVIALDEGENIITIVAEDKDGNYSERELAVIYEPLR